MDAEQEPAPACPNCGKPMRLARSVPKIAALPELRTYTCKLCGETVTEADEPGRKSEDNGDCADRGWPRAIRLGVAEPLYGQSSGDDMDSEPAVAVRSIAVMRRIRYWQRTRFLRFQAPGRATLDHELTSQAFVSGLARLESAARELADTAKRLKLPQGMLS